MKYNMKLTLKSSKITCVHLSVAAYLPFQPFQPLLKFVLFHDLLDLHCPASRRQPLATAVMAKSTVLPYGFYMLLFGLCSTCITANDLATDRSTPPDYKPTPHPPIFKAESIYNAPHDHSSHLPGQTISACGTIPHQDWEYRHGKYYISFPHSPCRFPDCQETCQENNGTLVFPGSPLENHSAHTYTTEHIGDVYLGVHLPLYQEKKGQCRIHECDNFLTYANGSQFRHQSWMGHSYDRLKNQERCYHMKAFSDPPTTVIVPTDCDTPLTAMCQAECPLPGTPIAPPPVQIQNHQDLSLAMMRLTNPVTVTSPPDTLDGDSSRAIPAKAYQMDGSIVPPFPTDPNFGAPSDVQSDYDLIGYDCSHPLDRTPVQMERSHNPCGSLAPPISQRNATFALLQKADKIPVTVRQCQITQTTIPYYCGVYSHTAINPKWINIEETVTLTPEACEQLWTTFTWEDPQKKVHSLQPNDTTRISYITIGSITNDKDGPVCDGADYWYNGKKYEHMVVTVSKKFSLITHEATVDEDDVIHIPRLDLILPCSMSKTYCRTQHYGTFTWDSLKRDQTCRYHQTRTTKGIIITDDRHQETFISTDKSMIRVIIKKPLSKCGQVIYATNYKKLFLTENAYTNSFPKGLALDEMSVWMYANQQDGYMMGELTRYIRTEFADIHHENCRRNTIAERFNYDKILSEQHGSTDGDTAALGGGYFLTVAGEAYYRYRCRRLVVRARASTDCYATLPISLYHDDRTRYLTERGKNQSLEEIEFFLEPNSRLITTRGIKIPCSTTFAALYAGIRGPWIRTDPRLSTSEVPESLNLKDFSSLPLEQLDAEAFDFEEGGIYTPQQIEEHDKHLEMARAVKDVQYSMGQRAQEAGWASGTFLQKAGYVFSPQAIIAKLESLSPIKKFWNFVSKWGQFLSTLVGIYWFFYIWYWFFTCLKSIWPPSPRRLAQRISDIFGRRPRRDRGPRRRFSPRGRRGQYSPANSEQQDAYEMPLRRSRSPHQRPSSPPRHDAPTQQRRNSTHSSLQSINTLERKYKAQPLTRQSAPKWSSPAWTRKRDHKLSPTAPSYRKLEDLDVPRYTTMPVASIPTAAQIKKNSLLDPVMPPEMAQLYPSFHPDILRRQVMEPSNVEAFNPAFTLDQQRLSLLSHRANPASSPKQSPTTDEPITNSLTKTPLSSFKTEDVPSNDSVLLLHYLEGILNSLPHISEVNDTFKSKCLAIEEQLLTLKPMLLSTGLTRQDLAEASDRLQLHHDTLVSMATTLPGVYENIFPTNTDLPKKNLTRPITLPKPKLTEITTTSC